MTTLLRHHRPVAQPDTRSAGRPNQHSRFNHHRLVESPKPAAGPERRPSRLVIAATAVSTALAVTALVVAVQTRGDTQPAIQVPDLRGLDTVIHSGATVTEPAFQVPDLRGLDTVISGSTTATPSVPDTEPAFQVTDLRGLDTVIYSGPTANPAAPDTEPAFQVTDLRGLDTAIYGG